MAGIKILSEEDRLKAAGHPYLVIAPEIYKFKGARFYLGSIRIIFYQDVYLVRNPSQKIFGAATWMTGTIGITRDLESLKPRIKYKIDEFIRDYRAANPKEGTFDKLKKYIK